MSANAGTFSWYELRTTDVDAAQRFYDDVIGWRTERMGDERRVHVGVHHVGDLAPLPERARAQGAPAHWLGHIGVHDLEASAARVVEHGGQLLGPVQQRADGHRVAILRDPDGAVLALSSRVERPPHEAIAWHELHATDGVQAGATYAALFGWTAAERLDLGADLGTYQLFSWPGAAHGVGGMSSMARAPHIHTHWLFYLTVDDLDDALVTVRAHDGRVINGPMEVPSGDRVAQCEDPQGAAFGLRQRAAR